MNKRSDACKVKFRIFCSATNGFWYLLDQRNHDSCTCFHVGHLPVHPKHTVEVSSNLPIEIQDSIKTLIDVGNAPSEIIAYVQQRFKKSVSTTSDIFAAKYMRCLMHVH